MLTAHAETRRPRAGLREPAPTIISSSPSSRGNCRCASPRSCGAATPQAVVAAADACASAISCFDVDRGELQRRRRARAAHRARAVHAAAARRKTPASTVSREALAGDGGAGNERTVDVQVNRLRRKIERDPANPLLSANGARRRLSAASSTADGQFRTACDEPHASCLSGAAPRPLARVLRAGSPR